MSFGLFSSFVAVVRCDDLSVPSGSVPIHARYDARRVLADEQATVCVEGHAVCHVARTRHIGDAVLAVPASTRVRSDVGEEKKPTLRVPDRALGEQEAGSELLDLDIPIDETEQLLGLDLEVHRVSSPPCPARVATRQRVRPPDSIQTRVEQRRSTGRSVPAALSFERRAEGIWSRSIPASTRTSLAIGSRRCSAAAG